MAVEPQTQRRWGEQLAGYVAASSCVLSLGNTAIRDVQYANKLIMAAIAALLPALVAQPAAHRRGRLG